MKQLAAALGQQPFDTIYSEGQSMDLDSAVEYALNANGG